MPFDAGQTGGPTLILISHCVPWEGPNPSNRRVWELLVTAARTHRVCLASLMDQPVNWQHWKEMSGYAARMLFQVQPLHHRILSRFVADGQFSPPLAVKTLGPAVRELTVPDPIHAVLCTHPMLLPLMRDVPCDLRVCDLADANRQAGGDIVTLRPSQPLAMLGQLLSPHTGDPAMSLSRLVPQAKQRITLPRREAA